DTGGATWSAFNAGFPNPLTTNVRALLASSSGTEVLAGTDTGVWRSTGGGAWQPLGQGAGPGKLNGSVQSLISMPGNVLLAGVASGGVWRSGDGGQSWTPPVPGNGMPASETPYGFVGQPPVVPAFVLATTHNGVFRSTDGGSSWSLASDGIPTSASPIQAWVDTRQPNLVYVSTASNGIYRSINGGITYSAINDGLGAVRARGFQIFTATEGAHLYAATEDGLWEALNTHAVAPPPPRWRAVTQEGLIEPRASNTIMWALTAPVVPGAGALGLIAGTQSNGGYFLSFEPPDSPCPSSNTTNVTTNCPRISDTTPIEAQSLSALNGRWTGTETIDYAYQWQQCSSTTDGSCADIADAEETTFVVPDGSTSRYRVKVTATNPAPSFNVVFRTSAITSPAAANPSAFPGSSQLSAPSITVNAPGQTTSPQVGDTMFAEYGITPNAFSDGWFNPRATSVAFRWLRCNGSGVDCNEIAGATRRSYTLTADDGTHDLRVRVTGTNASGTRQALSPSSYDVTSLPATVGDPIPDPDGGPSKSQAPALAGDAWVGETLAGTVGGWTDPTTEFSRRWVRCDAFGAACTYIQRVASTDPETGSTYVVRPDDLGYTLRMRVTADVNGDLGDNGLDNLLPHAVEVDTAPSAVVTARPGTGGGGGGGSGGGGAVADTVRPVVSGLRVSPRRFAVAARATAVVAARRRGRRRRGGTPKGTTFRFNLSERTTALVTIDRLGPGRKAGGRCRRPTRANRRGRRCVRAVRRGTITRRNLAAGRASIPFSGRIGRRPLARGPYRATVVASDAAGNVSRPTTVGFAIVKS
ncbi:MAG TPA: hypothetical protein VK506_10570, partial [Conexibacter sp.]|nr:hypothetical protein [Conexibacter sp.]